MDLLKTTVHLLHGQTDNCLTKIDRLFQDSPTEGVGTYTLAPLSLPSTSVHLPDLSVYLPLSLPPSLSFFHSPSLPLPLFLASLIELLAEVLDAEMTLFGKRVLSVEEWLRRYLKAWI